MKDIEDRLIRTASETKDRIATIELRSIENNDPRVAPRVVAMGGAFALVIVVIGVTALIATAETPLDRWGTGSDTLAPDDNLDNAGEACEAGIIYDTTTSVWSDTEIDPEDIVTTTATAPEGWTDGGECAGIVADTTTTVWADAESDAEDIVTTTATAPEGWTDPVVEPVNRTRLYVSHPGWVPALALEWDTGSLLFYNRGASVAALKDALPVDSHAHAKQWIDEYLGGRGGDPGVVITITYDNPETLTSSTSTSPPSVVATLWYVWSPSPGVSVEVVVWVDTVEEAETIVSSLRDLSETQWQDILAAHGQRPSSEITTTTVTAPTQP